MVELLRTNDPVLISWLSAILAEVDIDTIVLDKYTSNIEGSSSAIKGRVMVIEDDFKSTRLTFEAAAVELNGQVGAYEYPE
jgi:hypothetical protein